MVGRVMNSTLGVTDGCGELSGVEYNSAWWPPGRLMRRQTESFRMLNIGIYRRGLDVQSRPYHTAVAALRTLQLGSGVSTPNDTSRASGESRPVAAFRLVFDAPRAGHFCGACMMPDAYSFSSGGLTGAPLDGAGYER